MDARAVSPSAILTIPNGITAVRLLCIPLFLWLLFGQDDRTAAAWLLAVLGSTDWVDGYLARRLGQVSELGKVLDPVADRALFFTVVIALLVDGSVPAAVGILLMAREVLVSIAVLALAAAGSARIDVQWVGKAGTMALMVSLPLFMMQEPWGRASEFLAWLFAVPGLALMWYATWVYVPLARRALSEGRAARELSESPRGAPPPERPPKAKERR